jgi:uncharacterized membrane protein
MRLLSYKLILSLLILGCNYREEKISKGFNLESSFLSVSEQVFKPNCYSCHSGSEPAAGIDLSNYSKLVNPEMGLITFGDPLNSTLYLNVQSGRMPPGGPRLSDAEIKMIFNWIEQGAKQNF